jgi:hypothetical protein
MKKFLLYLCFIPVFSFSQNPNIKRTWHWYFGNHAGIDFSSGTAVADTNGALVTSEGCAAISDTVGNLQFYSDGRKVWNRLHQVMPNGTGIMGGANGSSTQQALIIPKPLSPNLYYLFTTDEAENSGANGMRYTVIDMNLDGGNGDVDTTQKNILLFAPCTEKLAAVNHCNDTNVWVMGHEVNNNHFRAYLVTANGIDTNAVVSAVGITASISGQIMFSSNGKMLCSAVGDTLEKVQLFEFDNYTGIIVNAITILENFKYNFANSFSPDNSKLYVGNNLSGELFQFDVSIFDSSLIVNSKFLIFDTTGIEGPRYLQNNALGQIIYNRGNVFDTLLYLIDDPNQIGSGSNFSINGIYLFRPARSALTNFNCSYFNNASSSGCSVGIGEYGNSDIIEIFPNPARDWIEVRGRRLNDISVYDVLGNICYKAVDLSSSPLRINFSNFKNGIYFLKIKSTTINNTFKIIKL